MNKLKKIEIQKYNEKVKNMTKEDKKNYDLLLNIQAKYELLVGELHKELFAEEYDFIFDDNVDAIKRKNGQNPMSGEYIQMVNEKRVKLGFLPLSENGYAEDSEKTKEYCKKLITGEVLY